MSLLALLFALAAFASFGLFTESHYRRVTRDRLSGRIKTRWRIAAWCTLALSATASIVAHGWVFGPVWWLGIIMLAAGAIFLALNLAPRGPGK